MIDVLMILIVNDLAGCRLRLILAGEHERELEAGFSSSSRWCELPSLPFDAPESSPHLILTLKW